MKEQDIRTTFKLFTEIAILSQLSTALLDKHLPSELKSSQFALLNHFVRVGDGSTHLQLANAMQVTKGAMTNTLKRLTTLDLVLIKVENALPFLEQLRLMLDNNR